MSEAEQKRGVVTRERRKKARIGAEAARSFLERLRDEVWAAGRLEVPGFGVFTIRQRKERKTVHPATGESISIPARKRVTFKPSKVWRHSPPVAAPPSEPKPPPAYVRTKKDPEVHAAMLEARAMREATLAKQTEIALRMARAGEPVRFIEARCGRRQDWIKNVCKKAGVSVNTRQHAEGP